MKILVYGAGVIGSYLSHELKKAEHDVTILARNSRYNEIKEKGLVIRHYVQMKTSTDFIKVTEKFDDSHYYDAVFIVMQRTQIDSVLPYIYSNTKCGLYIFVGNNPTADETYRKIQENSPVHPQVLFGFQASGGRRENGKVISIHFWRTPFAIGSIHESAVCKPHLDNIFQNTPFKIYRSSNIDAWLKCHVALVEPIAYATYWARGDLRKLSRNKKMLNLTIDAIREGYSVIKACGYNIEPAEDEQSIVKHRKRIYWMFKIMSATPLGKLAASDHAMSAVDEMNLLSSEFDKLKGKASIPTPAWDALEKYLINN